MYFTFSRGAWVALGGGLVHGIALDPRRLQLLVTGLALAPWAGLAVLAGLAGRMRSRRRARRLRLRPTTVTRC